MTSINPGYNGILAIGANVIRCTGFGVNVNQEYEAYKHVLGLNDFVAKNNRTKVEAPGNIQVQKTIIRPKPYSISGPINFPLTTGFNFSTIFEHVRTGSYIDVMDYNYFCSTANSSARRFRDCRFDSMNISVTAGDIVNISSNIFAKRISNIGSSSYQHQIPEKLVTWDKVGLTVNDFNVDISLLQNFTLDIKNNVQNIYTASPDNSSSDLGPHDLRLGTQDVSGSFTVYGMTGEEFLDACPASPTSSSQIVLTIDGFTVTINCVFLPRNTSGAVSTIVSTIPFMGVDYALGQ
jgi:hypothetical protein